MTAQSKNEPTVLHDCVRPSTHVSYTTTEQLSTVCPVKSLQFPIRAGGPADSHPPLREAPPAAWESGRRRLGERPGVVGPSPRRGHSRLPLS